MNHLFPRRMPKVKIEYHIGKTYGKLTIVEPVPNNGKYPKKWILRCDCGNTVVRTIAHASSVVSCGCMLKAENNPKIGEAHRAQRKFGVVTVNKNYNSHKFNGRGSNGYLSRVDWESIVFKPCHYCGGIDTKSVGKIRDRKYLDFDEESRLRYDVKLNGVDRVDNSVGYILSNCVPCCVVCNFMKHKLSAEEFINKVKSIYKHINS